jgi:hypothetical protein
MSNFFSMLKGQSCAQRARACGKSRQCCCTESQDSIIQNSRSALRSWLKSQIVYLDHRGNGRSESGDKERWTLKRWADDVYGFCQVLEIEKPIVIDRMSEPCVGRQRGSHDASRGFGGNCRCSSRHAWSLPSLRERGPSSFLGCTRIFLRDSAEIHHHVTNAST